MAFTAVDPSTPDAYPPNIKAVLKRPSGASSLLGLEITAVDVEAGAVQARFHAGETLCNKWGGLQGGMVAAMLDDLMSLAVGLSLEWGQITPTLEMKTSFLAAARPGTIAGEAWVVKRGSSVAFIEAKLTDESGQLLATASSTARIVTLKSKAEKT